MSGASTILNFDPVSCIVTVVMDDTDNSQIYGVTSDSGMVQTKDGIRQHFSVIHGSVVIVGQPDLVPKTVLAAVVFELPSGRRPAVGTAEIQYANTDILHPRITARTDQGETVSLSVRCEFAEGRQAPKSVRRVNH